MTWIIFNSDTLILSWCNYQNRLRVLKQENQKKTALQTIIHNVAYFLVPVICGYSPSAGDYLLGADHNNSMSRALE